MNLEIHSQNVANLSLVIGSKIGLTKPELKVLATASMLHDIGKNKVPKKILDKPESLTKEEYEIMKKHVFYGVEILKKSSNSNYKSCCDYILCHHENFDGTGYLGFTADKIPLYSRIIRIADTYSALTEKRCYKEAMMHNTAIEIMLGEKEKYDPRLFQVFLSYFDGIQIETC